MPAFLGRSYFCVKCNSGYQHLSRHHCNDPCTLCHNIHDERDEDWKYCQVCNRNFRNTSFTSRKHAAAIRRIIRITSVRNATKPSTEQCIGRYTNVMSIIAKSAKTFTMIIINAICRLLMREKPKTSLTPKIIKRFDLYFL